MSNTEELTFKNCKTLILTMDTEQLDELIHAIKYRRDEINRELKDKFVVGDKVWFTHNRDNKTISGTVSKVNRKRLVVKEDGSEWTAWNVPPSILTKLTNKGVDNG
jgi:putative ribosome biogenesis GTPase RsgA